MRPPRSIVWGPATDLRVFACAAHSGGGPSTYALVFRDSLADVDAHGFPPHLFEDPDALHQVPFDYPASAGALYETTFRVRRDASARTDRAPSLRACRATPSGRPRRSDRPIRSSADHASTSLSVIRGLLDKLAMTGLAP